MTAVYVIVVLVVLLAIAALSVRILKQYERGVQFRLGRVKDGARGPGVIFIVPLVDRVHRVSPADRHDADPVAGHHHPRQRQRRRVRGRLLPDRGRRALGGGDRERVLGDQSDRADDAARVVGRHTLDETLSETDTINQNIREILDVQTEEWGVEVTVVELKDIQLPETMQRAMARQAEAEREKRAKIIAAEGEALAAGELAHASDVMMAHPLALQLRNLQTLAEISVDKNSTVVFPAPLMSTIAELGAFLARETKAAGSAPDPLAAATATETAGAAQEAGPSGANGSSWQAERSDRTSNRRAQLLGRAWPVVRVGRVSGADAR